MISDETIAHDILHDGVTINPCLMTALMLCNITSQEIK